MVIVIVIVMLSIDVYDRKWKDRSGRIDRGVAVRRYVGGVGSSFKPTTSGIGGSESVGARAGGLTACAVSLALHGGAPRRDCSDSTALERKTFPG